MSQKSYDNSPTVYLIPTPIGNMDDLTYRTVETLKLVDVLFCEDTRETGKLLKYLDITKKMVANHDHNEVENRDKIVEYLNQGLNIGIVSDRGCPVISDPGLEAVRAAVSNKFNVVALPGANALIPALISSGINPKPFMFYGFLNSKSTKRIEELNSLKSEKATMIFYEAPHRIKDTLNDLQQVFGGDRKISISREITKKYEEIYRGTIDSLIKEDNDYKGELVVVVEGNLDSFDYSMSVIDHINLYIKDGKSSMEAIKTVAKERDMKKSEVYDIYLKSQGK